MQRPLLGFLMVLLWPVLLAWPALATAKPTRVVIGQIANDDDSTVRKAVKASIAADVKVVSKADVAAAVEKLGLSDELTDKEIKKLIKEVDADAVIKGTLDSGDAMALHLKIYLRGVVKPKAFTLSFKDASSDKFRATLRKTILNKLGVVEAPEAADAGAGGDEAAADPPPKPKKHKGDKGDKGDKPADPPPDDAAPAADPPVKPKKHKGDKGDKPADATPPPDDATAAAPTGDDSEAPLPKPKKGKKPKKVADDGASDDTAPAGGGDDDASVGASVTVGASSGPPAHAANRDALRVDVGPSITARTLRFASRSFAQAPKSYKNGAVPGVAIDGEIYPFGFGDTYGPLAGLGLAVAYDKTLSLTLNSAQDDGSVVSAKADENHFSVGPRYRIVFGRTVTSPSLTLGVSYGTRAFVVSRGGLMDPTQIDIPDIKYKGFQPGVGVRFPFAPAFAFVLDARAVLVTSAGPIQEASQYGQATVTGGEVTAGFDLVISKRIAVALTGSAALYGFKFKGNGAMANDRDGDPTSIDIGGAADRYYGGALTLGVLY